MWKKFHLTEKEISKKKKIARARRYEESISSDQKQENERKELRELEEMKSTLYLIRSKIK